MMRKTVIGVALSTFLFALCVSAEAQQPKKVPRIGYVSGGSDPSTPNPNIEAFRQGLRDLGYVEGKNIVVDYRYAEGKGGHFPSLVAELVQLKVDVLVSPAFNAIRAAKQATTTIPIIMVISEDPVASGFIDSLARPGGNVTGLTRLNRELSGKRLELLKEVVPTISRVGVFLGTDSNVSLIAFKEYEVAARALKIPLQSLKVRGPPNPDFDAAFQTAVKGHVDALITAISSVLVLHTKRIADLATKNWLPSMFERSDMVEAGGLASYATNEGENYRRAATYVDKILKGAKPADLPVEQARNFEFVINLKTAKQISLTIPPTVLARADKIIR